MFFLLFLLISILSFQIHADIYQWDESYFSDQPRPGAKKLTIDSGYSYYAIKKVYDGDTVLLVNGTKIRLSGINTPEVERRNKVAEPGGNDAKNWLINRLKNQKVRLEKDVEKHDKYSRVLAHLFTHDNNHINIELVHNGFASVNIHPPNLKYVDELLKAEKQAEQLKKGIWQFSAYNPRQFETINRSNFRGWQRVQGKVLSINETRSYFTLLFSDSFLLKIKKNSIEMFPEVETYLDKIIEIRGWINKQKKRYIMYIRHPSQIKIMPSISD